MKRLCIFTIIYLLFTNHASALPTAKITIKALDEHGTYISGAKVTVGFVAPNYSGIGTTEINKSGFTDSSGQFHASNESMNMLGVSIDKNGYYQSGTEYKFKSRSFPLNRWEPWDPTIKVVLKKKRNPVPMYIKGTDNLKVPVFDKPVGYDLVKGDMVAPYGSGIVSDFIFIFHTDNRAYTDYDCNFTLSFSNKYDGIQEYYFDNKDQSNYRWPFKPPESGYNKRIYKEKSMTPEKGYKSNEKKNVHYLFRIRSKVDKKGKIISAMYGKIKKEFEFDPKGDIFFGYYLNPDGTRNLEENPKRNLFKRP